MRRALRLVSAALRTADIPFFLAWGTALGAHREGQFIPHDSDIDLGVFDKDASLADVSEALRRAGILEIRRFSTEITVLVALVPVDIFVFEHGPPHRSFSYTGPCDRHPNKTCVFENTFDLETILFYDDTYHIPDLGFLSQSYGADWRRPKKYTYAESIEEEHNPNLVSRPQ